MARTVATNFTGGLQFPYATAAADLFHKEDIQTLALAVDGHDHSAGKGLIVSIASFPPGSITAAMLAANSVDSSKIADGTIAAVDMAAGAAAANVGALSGVLTGTLPAPGMTAGAALANLTPRSISVTSGSPFGGGISTSSTSLVGTTDSHPTNLQGELVLVMALMPVAIPANATVQGSIREVTSATQMPYPVIVANGTASLRSATLVIVWLYQSPATLTARAFETMWSTSTGTVTQAGVRQTSVLVLTR